MQRLLALLLLWATYSLAEQPVVRFSVAESWSMPLVRIEGDQPVEGLVFDLVQALAQEAGVRPEYHVLARLRMQQAMDAGDIDVRCYVSTQWFNDRPGNFVWSIPLIEQRDEWNARVDQVIVAIALNEAHSAASIANALHGFDAAVIVARKNVTQVRPTRALIDVLDQHRVPIVGTVLV